MASSFQAALARIAEEHQRDITEALLPLQKDNEELKKLVCHLKARLQLHEAIDAESSVPTIDLNPNDNLRLVASVAHAENLPNILGPPQHSPRGKMRNPFMSSTASTSTRKTVTLKNASSSNIQRSQTSISELSKKQCTLHRNRFRGLMEFQDGETLVYAKHLKLTLEKKAPEWFASKWDEDKLNELIGELLRLRSNVVDEESVSHCESDHAKSKGIPLPLFVEIMLQPDLHTKINENIDNFLEFQAHVLKEDVNDVMAKITRSSIASVKTKWQEEPQDARTNMRILNVIVASAVITSLMALGISLDHAPLSPFWIMLESIITCIFVAEIIIKLHVHGVRIYFCGNDRFFNVIDFCITIIAVADNLFSIIVQGTQMGHGVSASRLAMTARVLRLTRIARLIKAKNIPALQELANMLSGCFIALPTLCWILVLIFMWLYLVGILFRMSVGPEPDQDLLSECPSPDDLTPSDPPKCKLHYLYGEEFFGDVPTSMFTVFRCMIGDCASKGGKSLAAVFSNGFGSRFDASYYIGMIMVIVGLFNIINALFVESVISGLKRNDAKKKYEQMYDAKYVNGKLKKLKERILFLYGASSHGQKPILRRVSSFSQCNADLTSSIRGSVEVARLQHDFQEICLSEDDYVKLCTDEEVSSIFDDLDVTKYNREGLFDIFDVDGSGRVSEANLMKTLVMLRGEPQKSDIISSFVLLRNLRDRIDLIQQVQLDNQRQILLNQELMLAAAAAASK